MPPEVNPGIEMLAASIEKVPFDDLKAHHDAQAAIWGEGTQPLEARAQALILARGFSARLDGQDPRPAMEDARQAMSR